MTIRVLGFIALAAISSQTVRAQDFSDTPASQSQSQSQSQVINDDSGSNNLHPDTDAPSTGTSSAPDNTINNDDARNLQDNNPGNYDHIMNAANRTETPSKGGRMITINHRYYRSVHVSGIPASLAKMVHQTDPLAKLDFEGVKQSKHIAYVALSQSWKNANDMQVVNGNAIGAYKASVVNTHNIEKMEKEQIEAAKKAKKDYDAQSNKTSALEQFKSWTIGFGIVNFVLAVGGIILGLMAIAGIKSAIGTINLRFAGQDERISDVFDIAEVAHNIGRAAMDGIGSLATRVNSHDTRIGEVERRLNGSPGIIP